MPQVNLPFNIQDGDDDDAGPVMGNYEAIVAVVNGSLEMGSNVFTATPSSPITGKSALPGVSAAGLRSDAQFIIQGVENATDLPPSGNFLGRLVYITAGVSIGKLYMCTSTAATGTWVVVGNMAGTDVPLHAANHTDGGVDQLADNAVAERNQKPHTIYSATLTSNVTSISGSGWDTVIDVTGVTTTKDQTVMIVVDTLWENNDSSGRNCAVRVRDVTASNTTIWQSNQVEVPANNVQTAIQGTFIYTTPVAGGARTFRVAASCSTGGVASVRAQAQLNTSGAKPPTIQVVIL